MDLLSRLRKKTAKPRYIYDGISLKNGRETNMDSVGMLEKEIDGKQAVFLIVCDGVGSLKDGGYASAAVTKGMLQWFSELQSLEQIQQQMRELILRINREILETAALHDLKTATTLSAILLVDQQYYLVHAGDSRIYCFRDQRLYQLTKDDVSEEGALTNCIGHFENPWIYGVQGGHEKDVLLLCSDGMYKRMDIAFLKQQLSMQQPIRTTLEYLAQYVMQMGEKDNISIIIVKTCDEGV